MSNKRSPNKAVRAISVQRISAYCLLLFAYCLLVSCSLPNLAEADCAQARDVVREFYSFHFGNDMHLTEENIRSRERFLTRESADRLKGSPATTKDYFTDTQDFPKAFRVGECKVVEPGETVRFQVLLFWKDDVKSQQKPIFAFVKKENDSWLIDEVTPLDK